MLNHLYLLRKRTHRLNATIEGLWEYTMLEPSTIATDLVQISHLITEIQQEVPLPPGFLLKLHSPELTLKTSKTDLYKVLIELVKNSVQHHHKTEGQIDIFVRDTPGMWEFIIQDDGPGINPAYHERIFRLFQTHSSMFCDIFEF